MWLPVVDIQHGLMSNRRLPGEIREQAQQLRRDRTLAESELWEHLRARRLGVHFRFQHPTRHYILDFACVKLKLCIEVDGPTHDPVVDEWRDRHLQLAGWQVLRFTNGEIFDEMERVIAEIEIAIATRRASLDERRRRF